MSRRDYLKPGRGLVLGEEGECDQLHGGEDQGEDEGGLVPQLVPHIS